MATEVTDATFESEVLQAAEPVLVDFWAEWCGPCHAVSPVLERIAEERQLKLVKVNIDENQDLALRYGIQSIPNMILFEGGQPKANAVGAMPKGMLERSLGLVDFQEGEKGCVLGEEVLDLRNACPSPVFEPGLGEVVLDPVKAAFTHAG